MNKILVGIATVASVVATLLATQSQTFSRVDAGGLMLRMLVAGKGSPTVVFETGAGGSLEGWGSVPSEVSKFAKAISYDRAGNGLSERSTAPRDGRHIATELHTALYNAHALPPYILVGHSIGGPYIRVFAGMYPQEVSGMVLIDPTQEEMVAWNKEHRADEPVPADIPENIRNEVESGAATFAQAHESLIPANIPVFLIHVMWPSGRMPFPSIALDEAAERQLPGVPLRLKFHKEWVEGISGAQLIITEKSSHGGINFEEPELVVRTIREAIEKPLAVKKAIDPN